MVPPDWVWRGYSPHKVNSLIASIPKHRHRFEGAFPDPQQEWAGMDGNGYSPQDIREHLAVKLHFPGV